MAPKLKGHISRQGKTLRVSISGSQIDTAERYEGEYEVTPRADPQILDTKAKKMVDDFTVKAIPYFETSNEKGTTVIIGG